MNYIKNKENSLPDTSKRKDKIKLLFLIIAIVLLMVMGRFFHIDIKGLQSSLKRLPIFYAGIIFVVLYVIVTFFIWLSKDLFRLLGAVFFGATFSTLLVWIAEIINACILFHFARYLGRSSVDSYLKGKYNKLDEKLGKTSFLWLFLFRSAPLIPFRFLDLGVGLTKISFKKYLVAVILGSPLRIFWVQYALAGVGEEVFKNPYLLTEYLSSNKTLFILSLVYLILVVVVALKIKRKD